MQNEDETITVRFESVGYKTLDSGLVEEEGLLTVKDEASPGK